MATCAPTTPNRSSGALDGLYEACSQLKGFVVEKCSYEENQCLILSHRQLYNHPPLGPTSRVRILIQENQEYLVQVLLRDVESGSFSPEHTNEQLSQLCKKYVYDSKLFKFCPGIDTIEYEEIRQFIRFDIKSVRKTDTPFLRVDSVNCLLWHKLGETSSNGRREADAVICRPCSRLKCDLSRQRKRTLEESPSQRIKRQSVSSRARLSYMSPSSQQKRKENQQKERKVMKKKLDRYEGTEVPLDDEQNAEMESIVATINSGYQKEIEEIILEGEKHCVGHKLRNIWNGDRRNKDNDYKKDQLINRTGKRSNRWSSVTIRMALAVYVRCPSAYEALKSFKLLQLPSRSTLQAYTGAFLHEPGVAKGCIDDQVAKFVLYCQQRKAEGLRESKKEGVLIFDEVKVISRLMWNSRSQTLIGLSMTYEEMSSLGDIYQTLGQDSAAQTSYILQFLWRDLTSDYDIIGPYFTSSKTMDSKFIVSCVLETVKLFHLSGLLTSLLICDGAAPNLTTIKASHGHCGVYPVAREEEDPYCIKPFMTNPFHPPNPIFWLICPTHQLKNMINALFSSKEGGTKGFVLDEVLFGWKAISAMYERECKRVEKGLTRMVPRLKEIHIIRDSWTKLNVTPAKIMQQEHVLSELYHYISENPEKAAAEGTTKTLAYLEACNKLFENGFLSHKKVTSMESEVLISISEGYHFFTAWMDQILHNDTNFDHTVSTQRIFLAWQTFDLLRIDVYGFRSFCKYFLDKYPGYFVSPLRLSGSAVESLFGQFKYSSGGKLDAANYSTARAACMIKQVVANHHSGQDYRDKELSIPDLPLSKKEYKQHSSTV